MVLIKDIPVGNLVQDPSAYYTWTIVQHTSEYTVLMKSTVADSVPYRTNYTTQFQYNGSDLDNFLDQTFYNSLSSNLKSKIITASVPCYNTYGYTTVEYLSRRVYTFSMAELFNDNSKEGTGIPYFSSDARRATTSDWWTRSASTGDNSASFIITTSGSLSPRVKGALFSTRPVIRVSPNSLMTDTATYQFIFNTAPTISGSDTNIGQKTDPFTYNYTVNDTNSTDNLTITEKANGVTIRTITNAVRGQTYAADLSTVWKQMPVNTATTLTITVSDGSLSTTRIITFIRKEDRVVAYFKQASLTPESVQPEQVLVRVIRTIATNADFKVFVCNNGLDDSPTWEDATSAVLAGEAYTFTNRMKTAENYAVNVKIQVLKNTATSFSYIKALGFSYI